MGIQILHFDKPRTLGNDTEKSLSWSNVQTVLSSWRVLIYFLTVIPFSVSIDIENKEQVMVFKNYLCVTLDCYMCRE